MITIGYSTRKINDDFITKLKLSCGIPKCEIISIENNGEFSLTEVYNKILSQSKNDVVVFCHDDIIIETNNWGNKILKHFKRNPDYGILGKAGTKYLPKSGLWWDVGMTEVVGQVYHQHGGKKWLSQYSENKGNKIDDVIIVDGLFFAVNKKNIKNNFDENVSGFHFYDVDFCYQNFLNGVKIGVIYDITITHLSIGQTNQEWEKNRIKFSEKYSDSLPKIIPYEYSFEKTNKTEPLVSILMPIYNYGNRINQTLKSVFNQDYTNYEIILVDDGSTNEYVKIKLKLLESVEKIKVVYKENGGPSSARNEAFKHSKGDFILPLDSDDMILPSYIKTCVNILKTSKQISPVYCDTHHVGQIQGIEQRPEWSKERLMQGPFIVNCSMFHRESFQKVNGYDENLNGWEDYDMWLRMMKEGYIGKRIPKPLFIYFHHEKDNTVSAKANKNQNELYKKIIDKNFENKENEFKIQSLNDITDSVYVINLKEREDRKNHITSELKKIKCEKYNLIEAINGLEIFNNTNLPNGMYGLIKTYIKIYDIWKENKTDNILIIEDDCVFLDDFNKKLSLYFENIPNDWDMIYFGGNHNYHMGESTHKVNEYCMKLNSTYTAHCVVLKNYVFEELIFNLKKFNIENDVMLSNLQKKYNAYSPIKTMTKQLNNFSNIQNKFVNYDWLIN